MVTGVGASTPAAGKFTRLGVNTTADANNKPAVKSNAVLFAALEAANGGSGDVRFTVNKDVAAKTASLLFQDISPARQILASSATTTSPSRSARTARPTASPS
jgi:hypothetical protein